MSRSGRWTVMSMVIGMFVPCAVDAYVPTVLHYQAVLTDAGGVPVISTTSVTFTLYDAPSGGNIKWGESRSITPDSLGRFSILLGQAVPLHDSVFKQPPLYLGLQVASDPEMSPRTLVASSSYAFRVATIDGTIGGRITGDVEVLSSGTGSGLGVRDPGGNVAGYNPTSAVFVNPVGDTASALNPNGLFVFDQSTGDTVAAISSLDTSLTFGPSNVASGQNSLAVGSNNHASGQNAVAFGNFCMASGNYSSVSGGSDNSATFGDATVGGGRLNSAGGQWATVGGGLSNVAGNTYATVAGGNANQATGNYSCITGGASNQASNTNATVGGGSQNVAQGVSSFIGGGQDNQTGGVFAVVPGGRINAAFGDLSLAGGFRAKTQSGHHGSFVWADSNNFDFRSSTANEFSVRSTGGVRFVSAIDATGVPSSGVTLAAGGGSWSSISDRDAKENVLPVDGKELLERLSRIPVATWNYKSQSPAIRHIGPMAQDFYVAFGVGEDNQHITTVDADGVALAAIQALHQKIREIDELRSLVGQLQKQIDALNASTGQTEGR